MNDYDIVVVGGGLVGCAAAALFGGRKLRVAVVEARLPAVDLTDQRIDLRVSAIARASQTLLQDLDVWRRIDPAAIAAYREMHVWDAGVPPDSGEILRFDSAELGEPELGFIVENRRVLAALLRSLDELDSVALLAPASLGEIDFRDDGVVVRLEDGRRLRAGLVVGADGAGSRTRSLAGIETRGWSYDQKAVVTHVRTEKPHGDIAYQRFLTDGPIALLPLYDGRSSVVWSTTPQHADRLLELDAGEFNRQLGAATDLVLGEVVESDRRAAFPLQLQHAVDYARRGLVLVGDAAHAIHPLAGQGVNLGFADVRALGEALEGAGADTIGDLAALRRYERRRKSDNLLMMGSIDALQRLFGSRVEAVGRARQLGMSLFNRAGPLKQAVIRRAMGG